MGVMGAIKGDERAWFLSMRSILVATQARCACMSITGDPYHSHMKETRKGVTSLVKCTDIQGLRIGTLAMCV